MDCVEHDTTVNFLLWEPSLGETSPVGKLHAVYAGRLLIENGQDKHHA